MTKYIGARAAAYIFIMISFIIVIGSRDQICKIRGSLSLSLQAWYLDDGTIIGDTLVVGKVSELIMKDEPRCGLHLNVNKSDVFWPKEDLRSSLAGVFPPNIARPLHGAKLLCGPASVDFNLSSELVMKRMVTTIMLMDTISKINDPQCELLLLPTCAALRFALECIVTAPGPGFGDWQWRLATLLFAFGGLAMVPTSGLGWTINGISNGKEVYIGLGGGCDKPLRPTDMLLYSWDEGLDVCVDLTRSSPLTHNGMVDFVPDQVVIDAAHRKQVKYEAKCEDIVYGFLPFSFSSVGELEKDVALRSALERIVIASDVDLVIGNGGLPPFTFRGLGVYYAASRPAFEDALCGFNVKIETELLSNSSDIAAHKFVKKLVDIYFMRVI
nr:hypothetical protein [Tanacetum cinerariifolium]